MLLATDICYRKMLYLLLFGKVKTKMSDKSRVQQLIFSSFFRCFEVLKCNLAKLYIVL